MEAEALRNAAVRAVILAIRDGNRDRFFAAFAPDAKLTDDGEPQPLRTWADREIFRAHGRVEIERERHGGLELAGRFHSDQWDMETVWKFEIADGLVRRLDVAAV